MINLALNQTDFISRVELLVRKDQLRYTEAICQICDEHGLDPEEIAPLVTKQLKEKITLENSKSRAGSLF
jgi:hypothetical protein